MLKAVFLLENSHPIQFLLGQFHKLTSLSFFILKFHDSKKYENFTVCYLEYLDSAVIFLGPDLFSNYANLFRLVAFAFFISHAVVVQKL